MLDDPKHSSNIAWEPAGDRFTILSVDRFTNKTLPQFFRHSNLTSFIRQLNKYDFRKVKKLSSRISSRRPLVNYTFHHQHFRRDDPSSLDMVKRQTFTPHRCDQESRFKDEMWTKIGQLEASHREIQDFIYKMTISYRKLSDELLSCQSAIEDRDRTIQQLLEYALRPGA